MPKSTTNKKKPQKPRLSAKQKARIRQLEQDAKTNLSAISNFLEGLTEDSFLRAAIDNAVAEQCQRYNITPVKHGDNHQQFFSALEAILKFGPAIDDVKANEPKPEFDRLSFEELDRIAEFLITRLHHDKNAAQILCGILKYLSAMSNSEAVNYLDDDVSQLTQRIFLLSVAGSHAADGFTDDAHKQLREHVNAAFAPAEK